MSTLKRLKAGQTASFDVKKNRQKQDVGGRAMRGAQGQPGISKSAGEARRRTVLLADMANRNRHGGLIDRRFGEHSSLTPEEKMVERFKRERQKRAKQDVFRLDDDDEEEEELTHFGRSLGEDAGYGDMGGPGSDSDASAAEPGDAGPPKSKKDVMSELIAKSKLHKYERQKQQEDDDDEREQLDAELDAVRSLLPSGKTRDTGAEEKRDEDARYDEMVREMAFDRRARPENRTKTDEEIAAEMAEELLHKERERQRRMHGDDMEDADRHDGHGDGDEAGAFGLRWIGVQEDEPEFDDGIDDEDEEQGEHEDGDEVSAEEGELEDEDKFSDDQEDGADGVDMGDLLSDEDQAQPRPLIAPKASLPNAQVNGSQRKDIQYTYNCPRSLPEFLGMIGSVDERDIPTVVQRIRIMTSDKLHPENKAKLGVFAEVLLDAMLTLVERGAGFATLEALTSHLHELVQPFPGPVAEKFRSLLEELHATITDGRDPARSDFLLLTLVPVIFPSSDHYHLVVTPAALLIAELLASANTETQFARGLYLCTLLLHYQRLSKRYIPEVPAFLQKSILRFKEVGPLQYKADFTPLSYERLFAEDEDNEAYVPVCFRLVEMYADLWTDKLAFIEMFAPLQSAIASCAASPSRDRVLDKLGRRLKFAQQARRPLELQHHRPLPIPSYAPKFEEKYSLDRKSYDPDRERSRLQKLRAEHRKERKGAMRELRKDTAFIAREQLRDKKAADAAYHAKMAKLVGSVQSSEGREKNEYERMKRSRKNKK